MKQQTLFTGPPQRPLPRSVPPTDPNVKPQDVKAFTGQNAAVLARLRQGPATARELVDLAVNYKARVSDLRKAGYDVSCDEVEVENGRNFNVYRLVSEPKGQA